jgi:hypothetical protein
LLITAKNSIYIYLNFIIVGGDFVYLSVASSKVEIL